MQCNEHFSCLDSFWHCMIACEGSVIRAYDGDQLRFVLKVTPRGIPTLDGAVQEFDHLRNLDINGAKWTN